MKAGDIPNVSRYVNGGFDIYSDIGAVRDKPLMLAMYSKRQELLKYLCDNGADVTAQKARVGTLADAYEELYPLIAASRAATKSRRKRAAQEK